MLTYLRFTYRKKIVKMEGVRVEQGRRAGGINGHRAERKDTWREIQPVGVCGRKNLLDTPYAQLWVAREAADQWLIEG